MRLPKPPVGVAVGAGLFLLTLAAFFRPPLLPEIGRDLHMTTVGLGLLGSIFAVGRLAADFPAGRMSDRFRPGPMMSLSGVVVATGSMLLALTSAAGGAYAAMFVLGIGSALALTTAMAHFARAPRVRRGTALSAFAAWLLAGQSFGPTAGGSLGEAFGWRGALVVAASLALLVAVSSTFLRTPIADRESSPVTTRIDEDRVVPRRVLGFVYLLPAVQFAIGGAMLQTLVPIVADAELGIGPATVGLALGLGGVSRLTAALITGQISDRVSRKWALVPGQLLQTLGVAVFMLGGTATTWLAAIVLAALGSAGVNVGATVLADLSEGSTLGRRLGAFRFTGDAAFVVAPLLSGWLYQVGGRVLATLPLVMFSAVVMAGVWAVVPETGRRAERRV